MNTLVLLGLVASPDTIPTISPSPDPNSPGFVRYVYRELYHGHPLFTAILVFREGHRDFDLSDAHRVDVELFRRHPTPPRRRKQSFFFKGQEPIYTLKEAYNLLEGRYVLKTHTSKQGHEQQRWAKINFKRQSSMGNYAYEYFNASQFDLRGLLIERFQSDASSFIDHAVPLIESGFDTAIAVPTKLGLHLVSVAANPERRQLDITELGFEPRGNPDDN